MSRLLFFSRFSGRPMILKLSLLDLFPDPQLCDPGEFLCHDHVTCVSQSWLCDGDPDCPDDSDESIDTYFSTVK
uniref:LDL receptor related protein 1B n=1 Tax=Monodelphis domestica TaxID=13616 RepID=A0A5F8H846_MONDO